MRKGQGLVSNWLWRDRLVALLFVSVLLSLSCDEPFPPYTEPVDVLEVQIEAVTPDTADVYFDPILGQYYFNTPLILNVDVINLHDDLLQGEALVNGLITVQSFSAIPRTMTVPLSAGDLRTPSVFQGNIALAPDSAAEFSTLWLPITADGTVVFAGLPYTVVNGAKVYSPIDFQASAEVQLFEKVQSVEVTGYSFSIVFREITN